MVHVCRRINEGCTLRLASVSSRSVQGGRQIFLPCGGEVSNEAQKNVVSVL
jgi:hypothetical protein